jgi:hypothetical protein
VFVARGNADGSGHSDKVTLQITKSHLTSPGTSEEPAGVEDLKITYLLTFEKPLEGPHCDDASWLHEQILGAHRDVMQTSAGAGQRTDQMITDERFAKKLAAVDACARTRSTRSTRHQANASSGYSR